MANLLVKDGATVTKYLKASGAGSDGDPYIPQHLETNSEDILAVTEAVQIAVEGIEAAISGSEMQVDVVAALPTGSNTIGSVTTAYIAATPKAGTVASSGDNTLIAAPSAGNRIVLLAWSWWNETDTETTAILKTATINPLDRYIQTGKGQGKVPIMPAGYGVELAESEALVLNLSGANSHGYWVLYRIEAV